MVRPRNVNRVKNDVKVRDWEQEEFDSRTQIKVAAHAVTDLGEQVAQMTDNEFKKLDLPAQFEEAMSLLRKMNTNAPAYKRQKAYVGKLLRQNEELIVYIKDKLAEKEIKMKQQNAHFLKLERWRDRMVEEGDEALHAFLALYPHADRQQLRQWIRNAQKERDAAKPMKAAKEIFKYIKSLEW